MAGKAACAVTKGIIQGVATTFNPHHWYDMAVGTAGMLQFLGYILKEQAWLDGHDAQRWRALLSGNEKLYDELISRFEKHGTADIQKINAQFDQTCAQLAALSWDQLLENGAAFGTTLVLDSVACHAASYATTQAGRAFVQTVSELLYAPQAQAAEHMVEIAGLGKIALDDFAAKASEFILSWANISDDKLREMLTATNEKYASSQIKFEILLLNTPSGRRLVVLKSVCANL